MYVLHAILLLATYKEDYFVPILLRISKYLNLSDDVAGATLMAAGSSAPELFTALIGVFFFTGLDNPGPATNAASAAFNLCVIIGSSILFSGHKELKLQLYPFLRDAFIYCCALIELYIFWELLSPGWYICIHIHVYYTHQYKHPCM